MVVAAQRESKDMMGYSYILEPKHLPHGVEFLPLGSVYMKDIPVETEVGNIYIETEFVGGYVYDYNGNIIGGNNNKNKSGEKKASQPLVKITLDRDLGPTFLCRYQITPAKNLYYMNGYSTVDVVESIHILGEFEVNSGEAKDLREKYDIATKIND